MTLTAANRNALLSHKENHVLRELYDYGEGISCVGIADLCEIPEAVMYQRLATLIKKNHVVRTGTARSYLYHHIDKAPEGTVLNPPSTPKPKPKPIATVTPINSLTEELAELRAWKLEAIARYPDLAIPAEVMKGRQILKKLFKGDAHKLHQVDRGELDNGVLMQGILLGMEAK